MNASRSILFLGLLTLAACSNPGLDYAKKHSELSPVHRQILTSGKMPPGDAVAGMTHDEVKLAMRGFPATFDKLGGEETWIYVRKKAAPLGLDSESVSPSSRRDVPDANYAGPIYDLIERTTIFFTGDRATHATVVVDKP